MKLRLLWGRAGSGKTQRCLDEMRQDLKSSPFGPALVLITPEYATFQLEIALAKTPGLGGIARGTVAGFRRLAYRVLQETGGALRPHIDELGKKLLIRRCLQERQGNLRFFNRPGRRGGFAEDLAGMLRECKTYGLRSADLLQAAGQLEPGPLRDKLQDLAVVMEDFAQRIQGRYTDPEDYLTWTAERLGESGWLADARVWVDGFLWFNPQEMTVLKALLLHCREVTVTLCLDEPDQEAHQEESTVFHRVWRTRRRLLELAEECGVPVKEEGLTESQRFRSGVLRHLEQAILHSPTPPWQGGKEDALYVVEAANRRSEVEGIAREIIRLARDKEWRWRDMAVVLRDAEAYAELTIAVLGEYDIPCFTDQPRLPMHHPLAELLRSVLEVADTGWEYDPLFRCLKTDLMPLTRDEIDQLENYILEFGIRGSRWTQERPWTYVRNLTLGDEGELLAQEQALLERLDAVRRRVAACLEPAIREIRAATTVQQRLTGLFSLLTQIQAADRLTHWAEEAEQAGRLAEGREHRQMWEEVIGLFDQLAETSGGEELPLAEFRELFDEGLAGLRLNLVPPGLDHVAVVALDRTSLRDVKAVFLPGINEGVLPGRARLEGLFSDAERSRVQNLGVDMAPGAAADAYAEQLAVYLAVTRATDFLWVSYVLADEEGKGLVPSLLIKRLLAIGGKGVAKSLPVEWPPGREQEYIVRPRRGIYDFVATVRGAGGLAAVAPPWRCLYHWAAHHPVWSGHLRTCLLSLFHRNVVEPLPRELASKLYQRRGVLRGSVTRFEQFQACPFRHFVQYGLGVKERAVFRLQAADLGQFLHAVLKEFGTQIQAAGRSWTMLTEEEGRELCCQIVAELAPRLQNEILLSTEQNRYLLHRLERIAIRSVKRLLEFAKVSEFRPVALEASFGQGGGIPSLSLPLANGATLELQGQIDRVDQTEIAGQPYQLVIDYKTGQTKLSLFEVRHGLKLQLLTYLLVARQASDHWGGMAKPAGVFYFFVREPVVVKDSPLTAEEVEAEQNKQLRFQGWIDASPAVLQALDGTESGYSAFTAVQITKNGEIGKNSLSNVKTPEEFAALLHFTETTLRETAERILNGEIDIRPYRRADRRTPCSYCQMKPVCQFDVTLPGNDYRLLPRETEEELMKRIMGGEQTDELVQGTTAGD